MSDTGPMVLWFYKSDRLSVFFQATECPVVFKDPRHSLVLSCCSSFVFVSLLHLMKISLPKKNVIVHSGKKSQLEARQPRIFWFMNV